MTPPEPDHRHNLHTHFGQPRHAEGPGGEYHHHDARSGPGLATRKVDFNGKSTILSYDALGRLVKVWAAGPGPGHGESEREVAYR
jgi:hypothetical protein